MEQSTQYIVTEDKVQHSVRCKRLGITAMLEYTPCLVCASCLVTALYLVMLEAGLLTVADRLVYRISICTGSLGRRDCLVQWITRCKYVWHGVLTWPHTRCDVTHRLIKTKLVHLKMQFSFQYSMLL